MLAFSVVIPTYRRPGPLSACLSGLAQLRYPRDRFEVIVVDDGSGEPPEAVVDALREQLNVRLLTPPHSGPAGARNHGAAVSGAEYLAFTDDDCIADREWLSAMAEAFRSAPGCAVSGRRRNSLRSNPFSVASQTIHEVAVEQFNADPGRARFMSTSSMAVPAERFRAIGGFDESFRTAEDRELCDRWRRQGWQVTYEPRALVQHAHRLTLLTLWQQQFGFGRGAYRFHRSRRSVGAGFPQPDSRFYRELLRRPFRQDRGMGAVSLAALVFWAQAANAAGYFWEAGTRGRS